MATNTTVNSNYAGKEVGIFRRTFKEADTLRLGLLSFYDNINFKLNMRLLESTDGTTDYACIADGGFSTAAAGDLTLSERVLEPVKVMNLKQFCKEDFRKQWSGDSMGASASNPNMPSDIQEAILANELDQTAERTDEKIWTGDSANNGEWDGLVTLWENDANIIKANNGITPIGAAIDESNVLSELKKALSAIPVKKRRADLTVAVSPDVFQAYLFMLGSKGILNDGSTEPKQARFLKYNVTEVNGLPDNTIAIFDKRNVAFGTGLLADHTAIEIVDEDDINLLTGQIRMKMVYSAGVQYAYANEIVYYKSTTV